MANPWKAKVIEFNRRRREAEEKAEDLMALISAMPPGQVKLLLKDEVCGAILRKYGVSE